MSRCPYCQIESVTFDPATSWQEMSEFVAAAKKFEVAVFESTLGDLPQGKKMRKVRAALTQFKESRQAGVSCE